MNINIPNFKDFNAKEKLNHIKILFSSITKIVQKDTWILKPTYSMLFFSIIELSFIFWGIILFIEKMQLLWILIIVFALVLKIYKHFFFVKSKAIQSILLHQVIIKNTSNLSEAKVLYKTISNKMFFIWLIDYFIKNWTENSNKSGTIKKLLFSALEEIWDLLKNFMIPFVAIEKKPLQESIEDLKNFKSRVPEIVIGVLWFDFVWTFLLAALSPIFIIVLIIFWILSYALPFIITISTVPVGSENISISIILWGFYVMGLISSIIYVLADSVKTIYFTIFYMMIQHPDQINKDIAPKLIEFIEMKDVGKTITNPQQ